MTVKQCPFTPDHNTRRSQFLSNPSHHQLLVAVIMDIFHAIITITLKETVTVGTNM
jgi:hypothetical protein